MAANYTLLPEIRIDVLATAASLQESGFDDGRITATLTRYGVHPGEITEALNNLRSWKRMSRMRRAILPLLSLLQLLRM
jgi:hypothetical protein